MTARHVVLILLLVQTVLPQGATGSIQGTVVNINSGQPFPGARVELMGLDHGRVVLRSVASDQKGEFRFNDVAAGTDYQIVVSGNRVQTIAYGQKNWNDPWLPVRVNPGQQVADLRIGVEPVAAVRGRVVDSQGRGLLGARVVALRPVYSFSRRTLQGSMTAITNARGDYQFSSMPAGVYYLRVTPQNPDAATSMLLSTPARMDRPSPGTPSSVVKDPEGYPVTYFPATTNVEFAKPINLTAGGSADNATIVVTRVKTGRVRGTVTTNGRNVFAGEVLMQLANAAPDSSWTRTAEVRDGQFDIRGVLPGIYTVLARTGEVNARLWGRTSVEVKGGETSFVVARISPAPDISGKVSLADPTGAVEADFTQLSVYLVPENFSPVDQTLQRTELSVPSRSAIPSADGRFVLKDVAPWDYRVVVSSATSEANRPGRALGPVYTRSVRNNAAELSGIGLAVGATWEGELEIVLAADSGGIDGRVVDGNQEITETARIVLVPDARQLIDRYLAVAASPTGRFRFQGVAPGAYKVFAFLDAPTGAWYDPDFLKENESRGQAVRVGPGAAEYMEVSWSP